jgi:hypothetical protein
VNLGIDALSARIDRIDTRMTRMTESLDGVVIRMGLIEGAIATLSQRLERVEHAG